LKQELSYVECVHNDLYEFAKFYQFIV